MKKIVIITQHADNFSKLAKGLIAENASDIIWADSVASARQAASGLIDLIVIDEHVDGRSGLDIAKDMIQVNALANLVLVSTLSSEAFHEASEGLGILDRIPSHPDETDAKRLLNALAALA